MQIIITGGTGLIGRASVASLVKDGHGVTILSRRAEPVPGLGSKVQFVQWDGQTAKGWGHLANDADAIVNVAGESIGGTGLIPTRWTEERKRRILESRTNAGKAIVETLKAVTGKQPALIQSSAVGYYGPTGNAEITEVWPAGNDFLAKVCVQWEASTQPVVALGVRRVVIRTGLVLTPQGGVLPRLMLPFKLFAGGPLGSGKQWYPWIHLDDEIRAIRFLIETPAATGAFNLTAPMPVTNHELSHVLGKVMQRPAFIPAPAFALQLVLGEMSTLVLDGQRAIPTALAKVGFKFVFSDAESAVRNMLRM